MDKPLDIFGQNPRLSRLYTQLCFCFSLEDTAEVDESSIVEHVTNGVAKLTASIPWISGQVSKGRDGVARITPLKDLPFLRCKNLEKELPCFEDFRQACFPFTMLDESIIAPCNTLPEQSDLPAPVLSLQVNFIRGGMLLVVNAQHNCMDIRGQSQVIQLLSKTCRGESLSDEDIASTIIPRENIIPLLSNEGAHVVHSAPKQPSTNVLSNSPADWTYFSFSSSALQELKTTATADIATSFISTDDALSAFLWQAVTRARMHRLCQEETQSTFERQVDSRWHLGIRESYTGNVTCKVSVSMSLIDIVQQPLGAVASRLRAAISPEADIGLQTRIAATQLYHSLQTPSKTTSLSRPKVSSTDIKMSSWAKEGCYDWDFGGPLGKPEAVRRPRFEAWEGLAYMMPKTLDGEIVVALCLRTEDLQVLKTNDLFSQYARYIG